MTGYTINVGQDIASQDGSAVDVINKLPSVTVDLDNNIKMRGSKVTVLIDDTKVDLNDILEQLPSSAIELIKLITDPTAKYDSRNEGAIIEIQLKKNKRKGLNGHIMAGAGNSNAYSFSAGGNISLAKMNFTTNLSLKIQISLSVLNISYTFLYFFNIFCILNFRHFFLNQFVAPLFSGFRCVIFKIFDQC